MAENRNPIDPNQLLKNIVNSAVQGAIYRVIWSSPLGFSVAIILAALLYIVVSRYGGH